METYLTLPGLFRGAAGAGGLEASNGLFDQVVIPRTGSLFLGGSCLSGPGAKSETNCRDRTTLFYSLPLETKACPGGYVLAGSVKDEPSKIRIALQGRRYVEGQVQIGQRNRELWLVAPRLQELENSLAVDTGKKHELGQVVLAKFFLQAKIV